MSGRLSLNLASGLFVFFILSYAGFAQQAATPARLPEFRIFNDLLEEQRAIWSSPAHVKTRDLKWLAPLVGITAGLIATDSRSSRELTESKTGVSVSNRFSNTTLDCMFGAAGALYLDGRLAHEDRRIKTGLLAGEAIASSSIVVQLLKTVARRQRPNPNSTEGDFFAGGTSFPSGHSISAWAAATVLANRYPNKFWVKLSAYGFASAISFARCTGQNHFPSDVVVGGVLGYLIGHYISKR